MMEQDQDSVFYRLYSQKAHKKHDCSSLSNKKEREYSSNRQMVKKESMRDIHRGIRVSIVEKGGESTRESSVKNSCPTSRKGSEM